MIERLRLVDFKSFRDVSIPFGPLTLMVGTNAAGKSNVCDALRFLKGVGLGYRFSDIVADRYGRGGVVEWHGIRGGMRELPRRGQKRVRFECQIPVAAVPPYSVTHSMLLDFSDEHVGPTLVSEVLSDSKDDLSTTWDRRTGDIEWAKDVPHAQSVVLLTAAFQEHHEMARGYTDVLQSIRFLDLEPRAMRRESHISQTVLGDHGENLSSVLRALCEDPHRKLILLDWLGALTPVDVTDFAFEEAFGGKVMVFLVEANGNRTSADSASDGTLRFLAMVAALLSADSGRIYVFEDLDAGIHPTRLNVLLELVERACKSQGVQVIATTHNPLLLSFLSDEARAAALLVHRHPERGDSEVVRIMDLPDIERVLQHDTLGELMLSSWLDNIAAFTADEDPPEADGAA